MDCELMIIAALVFGGFFGALIMAIMATAKQPPDNSDA
jgi:hypothetical protein